MLKRGCILFVKGLLLNILLNVNLYIHMMQGRFQNLSAYNYLLGVDILPAAGLCLISIGLFRFLAKPLINICGSSMDFVGPVFLLVVSVAIILAAPYMTDLLTNFNDDTVAHVSAFIAGWFYWSYFPLFPWLAYPLCGAAFAMTWHARTVLTEGTCPGVFVSQPNAPPSQSSIVKASVAVTVVLGLTAFIMIRNLGYAIDTAVFLQQYYHHGALFHLWCLSFFVVWFLILYPIQRFLGETAPLLYLRWLGVNVTRFYVAQWLIIGNVATEVYKEWDLSTCALFAQGVILLSSLGVSVFNKVEEYVASKREQMTRGATDHGSGGGVKSSAEGACVVNIDAEMIRLVAGEENMDGAPSECRRKKISPGALSLAVEVC